MAKSLAFVPNSCSPRHGRNSKRYGPELTRRRAPEADVNWNAGVTIPTTYPGPSSTCLCSTNFDNVMQDQELIGGIVLALLLAWGASFLQGQRNQNDFVLSRPPAALKIDDANMMTSNLTDVPDNNKETTNATIEFDSTKSFDDWKEMSNPENYVWYNSELRRRQQQPPEPTRAAENPWILVGLLVLFTPIFSFEFFLTVSRQLLCGGVWEAASDWCTPYESLPF